MTFHVRIVELAHQIIEYFNSNFPHHDSLQDTTIARATFVTERTTRPNPPPKSRQASVEPQGRTRSRANSHGSSEDAQVVSLIPSDWPIDRSSLNQAVLEFHNRTDCFKQSRTFTRWEEAFFETLPIRQVYLPLGPKPRSEGNTPPRPAQPPLQINPVPSSTLFRTAPQPTPTESPETPNITPTDEEQASQPPSVGQPDNMSNVNSTPAATGTAGESADDTGFTPRQMQTLRELLSHARAAAAQPAPAQPPVQPPPAPPTSTAPWKPQDIGFFYPDAPTSWGRDDVIDKEGKTYYRDVHAFTNRLKVAALTRDAARIRQNLDSCLKGEAESWWNQELNDITRTGLVATDNGVEEWIKILQRRFRIKGSQALRKLNETKYSLQDLRDGRSPTSYILDVSSAAKHCGQGDTEYAQVLHAWNNLDVALRATIDEPEEDMTIEEFTEIVRRKQTNWTDRFASNDRYANSMYNQRGSYRGNFTPRSNYRGRGRGSYPRQFERPAYQYQPRYQAQDYANGQYRGYSGNNNQYGGNNNQYGGRYNQRDGNYQGKAQQDRPELPAPKQQLQLPAPKGTPNANLPGRQPWNQQPRKQVAFHADPKESEESTEDPYGQEAEFDPYYDESEMPMDDPQEQPYDDGAYDPEVDTFHADPTTATCYGCSEAFDSHNNLYKHLKTCTATPQAFHASPDCAPRVIVSQRPADPDTPYGYAFRNWKYATTMAFCQDASKPLPICVDSGCTMTLVSKKFLEQQCDKIPRLACPRIPVRGVGDSTESSEMVVIPLTLPAVLPDEERTPVLAQISVEAHVIDDLRVNLLLGIDNMAPEGITIDLDKRMLRIKSCEDAEAKISVTPRKDHQATRPVYSDAKVIIPPRSEAKIPLRCRLGKEERLPTDRDYIFDPAMPPLQAYVQIMDHNLPFAHVINNTDRQVTIPRRSRVGTLREYDATGAYLVDPTAEPLALSLPKEQPQQELDDNLDIPGSLEESPHAINVNPTGAEVKLPNGITIYGDEETAKYFAQICNEFPEIWEDRGNAVDLPEDEWMQIPLLPLEDRKLQTQAKVYPLGQKDREVIDELFDKLHAQGRMEWATDHTPSGYPVFVVWKEVNGVRKGRPVIDVRELNKIVEPDVYPMTQQAEVINSVKGCHYITVLDCTSFFYQWRVRRDHRRRLSVVSHRGQEIPSVAIMGYINSPAYVQRKIDLFLKKFKKFVRCYIDDLVAASITMEKHGKHLRKIFSLFRDKNIVINPKKAFIGFPSVRLLGHKVSSLGLTLTEDRIAALARITFPKNLKDLETYLGTTGWLRNYVPFYAYRAEPLQARKTMLLKDAPVKGRPRTQFSARTPLGKPTEKEEKAFNDIQAVFAKGLFLVHHDSMRYLFFDVDASKQRGFGVMIFHVKPEWAPLKEIQHGKTPDFETPPPSTMVEPIMFLSKILTPAETRYWPTELEVACLVWALKKVRHMVEATELPVVIYTDHSATLQIARQTSLTTSSTDKLNLRLIQAAQYIQRFNLQIFHKPGRTHIVPDALSRLQSDAPTDQDEPLEDLAAEATDAFLVDYTATVVTMSPQFQQRLLDAYQQDSRLATILDVIKANNALPVENRTKLPYHINPDDNLLYHDHGDTAQLCIPRPLVGDVIKIAHSDAHLGPQRTIEKLDGLSIYKKTHLVKEYIYHCPSCLQNATRRHKPYGTLQPIITEPSLFHTVTIDIVLGLPKGRFDAGMTITCKASKRTAFIPGRQDWDAESWAKPFVKQLVMGDWGTPSCIISDRDKKFLSDFWATIFKSLGVDLLYTTAYHPQADGQSEITNQTYEIALRHTIAALEDPRQWEDSALSLQALFNSATASATGISPHQYMYGQKLKTPLQLAQAFQDQSPQDFSSRLDANEALHTAAVFMKKYYDKKHTPRFFATGDKVLLRIGKGYDTPLLQAYGKFAPRYAGPFTIRRRVGSLAYLLDLPAHFRIHPVISIAHLEPAPREEDPFGRTPLAPGPVAMEGDSDEWKSYEIEKIMAKRTKTLKRGNKVEYLIRWKGYGPEEDRWYPEHALQEAKELIQQYEHDREESTSPIRPRRGRPAKAAA